MILNIIFNYTLQGMILNAAFFIHRILQEKNFFLRILEILENSY
jgi:hypothetical protein